MDTTSASFAEQVGGIGDNADDCIPLSQSRYILAKYRLTQQALPPPVPEHVDEKDFERTATIGPEFLTPNVHGGEIQCNKETCCQIVWCLCVPCISASLCWIRCCEKIYDCLGKYLTEKEETSQMTCCTMTCCRL